MSGASVFSRQAPDDLSNDINLLSYYRPGLAWGRRESCGYYGIPRICVRTVRESHGVGLEVTGIPQRWDRSPVGVPQSWRWITWCCRSRTHI